MRELLAQLEARYAWHSLVVDGHEWRWLDTQASGPATVLLPGSVGDGAMFVRTLLSLGERLRLIAVTYPALADPMRLADGLAAVVKHLGLPPGRVVSSSFSAYWLQFYGLRHPQNVTSLVLGNGFVDGSDLAANPMFDRSFVEGISAQDLAEITKTRCWLEERALRESIEHGGRDWEEGIVLALYMPLFQLTSVMGNR